MLYDRTCFHKQIKANQNSIFSIRVLTSATASFLAITVPEHCLFVGCLTFQQHASVSKGRIRSDKFTCCHTEIEVADQTFHLTQSQYTDTEPGPTSPSTDPIMPGA